MTTTTARQPFSREQRWTLLATSIGLFMIYLDATIINVALPAIQEDFSANEQGVQWVVAAYSLTMAMFIMSAATLADQRGRRRVYLGGLALFAVASALCGLAPSLPVLVIGRGLQGVGAAVVNVASLALVSAAFPDPKMKAKAIGLWTAIASIGLALGPVVGGVLTETLGWRSIFFINVGVGAVGIVLARAVVAESRDPRPRDLDLAGQLLFIAGIGALTYALIEGPHSGWASPMIIGLFVGAVVLIVSFVVVELRSNEPMMDVRLFSDRVYDVAILTLFVVLFCIYGMTLITTQYLQNVRDYEPAQAGIVLGVYTLPVMILSPIAGALVVRSGSRPPIIWGLCSLIVGLLILAAGIGGSIVFVVVGLLFIGAGGGLVLTPTTNAAMEAVPPDRGGMASGILSAQRALGSTAGFAIMGSILAGVIASTLPDKFAPYVPEPDLTTEVDAVVDSANPRAVVSVIGRAQPLPQPVRDRAELLAAADDAFVQGIRLALLIGAGLAVAILVAAFVILPRRAARERKDMSISQSIVRQEDAGHIP